MSDPLSHPSDQSDQPGEKKPNLVRLLVLILMIAVLVVAAKYFNIPGLLRNALAGIDGLGPWGPVAFIVIYILASILFVPGTILTLGAGVVFGVIAGSIYAFIGAILGATAAFLVGRYLLRDWVARQIENNLKFKAIDQAVAAEGFKIVLLSRLSPVFPFNLLNYAFGVTRVSLQDYFLGSVGMIPGTFMYVYIGSLAGNLTMIDTQPTSPEAETLQWVIRVVGFVATVAVSVYVTRVARRVLQERVS